MSVEALVAQWVGGKPLGKRIYTAGEAAAVGREYQNHWNSISRSEGDDPTFRESLRIRARRLAAHTQLPPVGLPTHTNTLIFWYLRRVNHFLRPWDVALARAKMGRDYSKCIFVSVSSCIHFSTALPSVLSHSCNKQPFNILYWKETLQPTDRIRTTLTELNEPAGLSALLYSDVRCLLAPSHFPLLPGGLSHSDCEYRFRRWRHDPKCQLKKTGEPTCVGRGRLSAQRSVCTALKRFCRILQSDSKEQQCWCSEW